MLKRIKIEGYKSLSGVEVSLQQLSVLFGPNAAGKSNFLDAIQLLSQIATSRTLKQAFEPPYRGKPLESFTFEGSGLDDLLRKDSASFRIEVDVQLSPSVVEKVNRQVREMKRGKSNDDKNGDGTTDANCSGFAERQKRLQKIVEPIRDRVIFAIPDPHVERWLLLDSAAFKTVAAPAPMPASGNSPNRCRRCTRRKLTRSVGSTGCWPGRKGWDCRMLIATSCFGGEP